MFLNLVSVVFRWAYTIWLIRLSCAVHIMLMGEKRQYARKRLIAFAPGAYQYFTTLHCNTPSNVYLCKRRSMPAVHIEMYKMLNDCMCVLYPIFTYWQGRYSHLGQLFFMPKSPLSRFAKLGRVSRTVVYSTKWCPPSQLYALFAVYLLAPFQISRSKWNKTRKK